MFQSERIIDFVTGDSKSKCEVNSFSDLLNIKSKSSLGTDYNINNNAFCNLQPKSKRKRHISCQKLTKRKVEA